MTITKIQFTKQGTMNVSYRNTDGDLIDFKGGNLVHKDFKLALNALIPHLALITEQREAYGRTLKDVRGDSITDESNDSVMKRFTVDTIVFADDMQEVSIAGNRLLISKGVVSLATPKIRLDDTDDYQYVNELSLDIDAVVYEAKAYVTEKKWGVKEGTLEFSDINPFAGVQADEVPDGEPKEKGKGKKGKKAA